MSLRAPQEGALWYEIWWQCWQWWWCALGGVHGGLSAQEIFVLWAESGGQSVAAGWVSSQAVKIQSAHHHQISPG